MLEHVAVLSIHPDSPLARQYARNAATFGAMAARARASRTGRFKGFTAADLEASAESYRAYSEGRAYPLALGPNGPAWISRQRGGAR